MAPTLLRVVLDTNILVRGLLNENSPSGRILRASEERRIVPVLSLAVLGEYRTILSDPDLVEAYPQLDEHRVKTALERLWYVADVCRRIRVRFELPRDPKDSKLVELAIGGWATHLITTDRDLLDLGTGQSPAARKFRRHLPEIEVIKPHAFVEGWPGLFG